MSLIIKAITIAIMIVDDINNNDLINITKIMLSGL